MNASVLILYLQSYSLAGPPPVVRMVWGFPPQPVSALPAASKLNVIHTTIRDERTADSGTWCTGRASVRRFGHLVPHGNAAR